jgi:hypothetical protein
MKKKILFLVAMSVFALLACQATFAGVLQLVSVDTLVSGLRSTDEVKAYCHIKNTSASTVNIKAEFTIIELAKGHKYQVCTSLTCYPPKIVDWTAPAFPIEAMSTLGDNDLYLGLIIDSIEGTSSFKVKVYNAADETDFIEYNVTFKISSSGVYEYYTQNSTAYPNPASNSVTLKLDNKTLANSEITLFSATGSVLMTQQVNSGIDSITLDLNNLTSGTYYFTVNANNSNLSSGRFTISK